MIMYLRRKVTPLMRELADDRGQTLVEYSLILALISLALVTSLTGLKGDIANVFTNIGNVLASAL